MNIFPPSSPPLPEMPEVPPPDPVRSARPLRPLDRLLGLIPPAVRRGLTVAGRVLAVLAGAILVVLLAAGAMGASRAVEPVATAVQQRPSTTTEKETAKLERKLAATSPRGTWVVIDTYRNKLRVFRDGEVFHEAVCSTGSGAVVRDPRTGRLWIFDTPIGERRVQRKVKDPVWNKPDWAFIEEGFVPPKGGSERYDDFSLGEYGLYLGDGYIIHGTIFQSLLGQAITHGCVRLGDKDLELVYRQVPLGARVYLY